MRVIIAGSRAATNEQVLKALGSCPWSGLISCVVCGGARGADEFGAGWARDHQLEVAMYPADWKRYGRRAGPMRNKLMAENADGLIAVWDGGSRGTFNMLDTALQLGLRIFLLRTDLALFWEAPASGIREEAWEFAEERAAIMEFAGELDTQQAELQAGLEARQRYAPHTTNSDEQ